MRGIPVRSTGDPLTLTLVLAGSYSQFSNWCMFSRVNPRSTMVRYINGAEALRGYHAFDLVYTGLWGARQDALEIGRVIRYYRDSGRISRTYDQYESCEVEPDVVD